MREKEESLLELTGYKLKIVERTGRKLEDIFPKNNPWAGQDCQRDSCLLCKTKMKSGENLDQECSKRNTIYMTWCHTCKEEAEKKAQEGGKTKEYIYIGETSRSSYERLGEHVKARENVSTTSHMLKHMLDMHEGKEMENVEFRAKVMKHARTAYERQIFESVSIQSNREKHYMLNSKAEFNRCAIPRFMLKLGEREMKEEREKQEEDKKKDEALEARIRELKKDKVKD